MSFRVPPAGVLKVPATGNNNRPNIKAPMSQEESNPYFRQAASESNASNNTSPMQLLAMICSRDKSMRPKRLNRSVKLNNGLAIQVIRAKTIYKIRIGKIHGSQAGSAAERPRSA